LEEYIVSLGHLENDICIYYTYKSKPEPLTLYNCSLEWYRGYVTFVYATRDVGIMELALHIYKRTPTNLRWLLIG